MDAPHQALYPAPLPLPTLCEVCYRFVDWRPEEVLSTPLSTPRQLLKLDSFEGCRELMRALSLHLRQVRDFGVDPVRGTSVHGSTSMLACNTCRISSPSTKTAAVLPYPK
jgi:hypothetical protein